MPQVIAARAGSTWRKSRPRSAPRPWLSAELGKLECRQDFAFDRTWNGHHYATKQVRPIFVEEETEIVVITFTRTISSEDQT